MSLAEQNKFKQLIKEEYIKCAKDPIFFMKKYVYIQTAEGRQLFTLFPFQEKCLYLLHKHDRLIFLKARQLGITTLLAGYSLWMMIFRKDSKILAIAPDQEKAINLLDKVKFAFSELPEWYKNLYKIQEDKFNETKFSLNNGSEMRALTGASKSARGFTGNLLIMDETAFIDNAEELWGSCQQTIANAHGKAVMLSTPNGFGNFYHQTWLKAESGANNFVPIKLKWDMHPERNAAWRKEQDAELGERLAAQECDGSFLTSGDNYFDDLDRTYLTNTIIEPLEKRMQKSTYWIFDYCHPGRSYAIAADVSRGDGKDYSTFHIFDVDTMEQVAEYKDQPDTTEFARLLVQVCIEWNMAYLIVENNGLGWAVVQKIVEIGYENMHYSTKQEMDMNDYLENFYDVNKDGLIPGFRTTTKTRPAVINALGLNVRTRVLKIKSKRFLTEAETFIWKDGKAQAQRGYNDDLIIPAGIFCYLRETVLAYRTKGIAMTRAVLNATKKIDYTAIAKSNIKPKIDPWKWRVNDRDEDLRWLLDK